MMISSTMATWRRLEGSYAGVVTHLGGEDSRHSPSKIKEAPGAQPAPAAAAAPRVMCRQPPLSVLNSKQRPPYSPSGSLVGHEDGARFEHAVHLAVHLAGRRAGRVGSRAMRGIPQTTQSAVGRGVRTPLACAGTAHAQPAELRCRRPASPPAPHLLQRGRVAGGLHGVCCVKGLGLPGGKSGQGGQMGEAANRCACN